MMKSRKKSTPETSQALIADLELTVIGTLAFIDSIRTEWVRTVSSSVPPFPNELAYDRPHVLPSSSSQTSPALQKKG